MRVLLGEVEWFEVDSVKACLPMPDFVEGVSFSETVVVVKDGRWVGCQLYVGEGYMGWMELGPEDVSLLERCPHFRGWYVQASMELGPEDVSLLERPHSVGGMYRLQWSWT